MIGILLISHSELCCGMKKSCEMIAGEQKDLFTLSLTDEGVDNFRMQLLATLEELKKNYQDIIMVSDIPNATPYNECYRYILSNKTKDILLSGMNLPMVLELCILHEFNDDAQSLAEQVMESGRRGIQKLNN